jgi:hypothetical protein
MAGPAKKRAQADKQANGSSNGSSSESRDPTQRSAPKSIPRLDGNRDPNVRAPVDYTDPRDLKNISDFLGISGWYQARGVSTNNPMSQPSCASCIYPSLRTSTALIFTLRLCKQLQARILPLSVLVHSLSCEQECILRCRMWLSSSSSFLSIQNAIWILSSFFPKNPSFIFIFSASLISHLHHGWPSRLPKPLLPGHLSLHSEAQ